LNRKMMQRMLLDKVDEIVMANDGEDAVEVVRRRMTSGETIDIILMDFIMPRKEGPEATRDIRGLGFRGKIFGITGNALQVDLDKFIRYGADRVFIKPVDIGDLIAAFRGEIALQFLRSECETC